MELDLHAGLAPRARAAVDKARGEFDIDVCRNRMDAAHLAVVTAWMLQLIPKHDNITADVNAVHDFLIAFQAFIPKAPIQ